MLNKPFTDSAHRNQRYRRITRLLSVFLLLFTIAAHAGAVEGEILAGPEHLTLMQQGGLVLYMRHGATDARIPDQIPVRLDDCTSQRPLSDAGRTELKQVGTHIAALAIPVQVVVSSPFCRAIESTHLVFGPPDLVDPELRYTAGMPAAERKPAVARTRHWLSTPVSSANSNRVVVAHGPNIAELMDYLPAEATVVLFRPLGDADGFEYLASITPGHWAELSGTADESSE